MPEPYVPTGDLTTSSALLAELEVATIDASTNANALNTAQATALSSKITAENALGGKFNLFVFMGA